MRRQFAVMWPDGRASIVETGGDVPADVHGGGVYETTSAPIRRGWTVDIIDGAPVARARPAPAVGFSEPPQ
jgi:hypothetical protein